MCRQACSTVCVACLVAALATRKNRIPVYAILSMAALAFALILAGSLQMILEFASVTFLLVSLLMAYANFRIRAQTQSSLLVTVIAFLGLLVGTVLIFSYEYRNQPEQLVFIVTLYAILSVGSWFFSRKQHRRRHPS